MRIFKTSLFNLTIRENLLFGRDGACEAQMTDACTRANIMDFIRQLPLGFEMVTHRSTSAVKCSRCVCLAPPSRF